MELDGVIRYLSRERVLKILRVGCKYTQTQPNFFIALAFVSTKTIQRFNKQYRHIDTPTDVLSFGYKKPKGNKEKYFLGEMMITPTIARKQAKIQGHSLKKELEFLIIHGFLHLRGYDHKTTKEAKTMFRLHNTIAQSL
ncbi:MAG: rRNA maturation RNase YbeY [Candidatus Kerfeldbacteria bacterium RIFCSPHIGHO2_02_FULL_42_14]|uniref:Endoribonuclease YbeY n=1 Tax=Candidatus Kerfeldbacteria bacterium RIFCSPHIGHO2_02_FULL_42_14 TaxID=1798540 RepID=A0A1G2ATH3_9BACT|nr:MAG: rRNA maturation RNase YbeY [Candidatus Kerfeldbacteria bacterium RIFCSPHIGHO2_02_FULL_42_14]OGY81275.1 MAG: rRNA maturation RNase YbeY [Candidatus Kerfeldbacteria bacterium RIFCSPHIGHO2_12_FULL_42_13]OGY83550.1 MAG: rRNA maturation RNase YbeY [Candidatus Kerfeldbacteria bacterium RIFCSPLOWO2_02_FULL_42_19]OGY85794.1 MAG: rRNA maturation RNase YbeY [Candidatus Kerfeldbacteria bacterium RIFCSPLOWO2_12_FULL_43_9]